MIFSHRKTQIFSINANLDTNLDAFTHTLRSCWPSGMITLSSLTHASYRVGLRALRLCVRPKNTP